jgi:protein-tyrosine phosphatase
MSLLFVREPLSIFIRYVDFGSSTTTLSPNLRDYQAQSLSLFVSSQEFHCKHIQVQDDLATDLSVHFVDCISYIDQARELGAVLVHCKAGASRSASIVIAWLMHSCGFGYNDAHLLLKSRRPCISPNRAFIEQLKRFEMHLQKMKTLTSPSTSSSNTGLKISSPKLNSNTTHPPSPTSTTYRPRRGSYRVPRPTLPRATPRRTNLPLSRRVNTTDR